MKNTIKFLTVLVAVISFTFTSCDEIDDLTEVDFNSSLSGAYNLNFEAESTKNINESLTLDLASDNDISKYLNKLNEVEITKITYQITKFTGDQYVDMNVGLYQYEEKENKIIIAPRDYNLDSETSVVYEITDTAILNAISTELLNSKQVKLLLKGDYQSLSSATAEITVTVYFKATANAL